MAQRFLSNIKINDAYTFPASDGTSGQVISTDGAGNLSFIDVESEAGATVIYKDNFFRGRLNGNLHARKCCK